MNYLDVFLKSHQLTRYRVSKLTKLNEPQLAKMNADNFNVTTVRTISELAKATNLEPWEVLHQLSDIINNPFFQFVKNNNLDQELVDATQKYLINCLKDNKQLPEDNINNVDELKELLN